MANIPFLFCFGATKEEVSLIKSWVSSKRYQLGWSDIARRQEVERILLSLQRRSPDDLVASLPVWHMMIVHLALKENSSNGRNHVVLDFSFTSPPVVWQLQWVWITLKHPGELWHILHTLIDSLKNWDRQSNHLERVSVCFHWPVVWLPSNKLSKRVFLLWSDTGVLNKSDFLN